MWFFGPIAQFYNWILIFIGFEDMMLGSLFMLGPVFGLVFALIFITGSKKIDPLFVLFAAMGLFVVFGMLPMFVMQNSLHECKREVITYLEEYDSTVYVFNCRRRTDMTDEFGEWKKSDIPQLETPQKM